MLCLKIMKFFIVLALFKIVNLVGGTKDAKVLGGRLANRSEFPFVVALVDKNGLHCGGTLVTLYSFFTAAHCVVIESWPFGKMINIRFTVVGGSLEFDFNSKDPGIQFRHLVSAQVHPGYKTKKNGGTYNDIAIGYVLSPFDKSPSLSPMKLFSKNKPDFKQAWESQVISSKSCIGMGWGYTKKINSTKRRPFAGISPYLKVVPMKPQNSDYCRRYLVGKGDLDMTEKGEVCLSTSDGVGVCFGDSGGPLICQGYVFGLLSSVFKECANKFYPARYILLWPYVDFYYLGSSVKSFSTSLVQHKSFTSSIFILYINLLLNE